MVWKEIGNTFEYLSKNFGWQDDTNFLFNEVSCMQEYVTNQKVQTWNNRNNPAECRWVEIFINHFQENHTGCFMSNAEPYKL